MTIKESFYLEATNEFESDDRNAALWAKCMSLCEGDEQKAKYKYINDRVKTIKREKEIITNNRTKHYRKGKPFLYNLYCGNYSLAQTYWIFGVVVGIILSIPSNFITSRDWYFFFLFCISIYQVAYLSGLWRSSNKYNDPKVWVILAKLVVILGSISLPLHWFAFVNNQYFF